MGGVGADPEQLLQMPFDLLLTKGTASLTSMAPKIEKILIFVTCATVWQIFYLLAKWLSSEYHRKKGFKAIAFAQVLPNTELKGIKRPKQVFKFKSYCKRFQKAKKGIKRPKGFKGKKA